MGRYLIIAIAVVAAAVFGPDLARTYLDDGRLLAAARVDDGESDASQTSSGLRTLVLKAGQNGHFQVSAHFNGRPVQSLIDTGASAVALPLAVARAAGIAPSASDYTVRVRTANGVALAAPVRLREMRLGSIRMRNVEALVMPAGALEIPLIGMSALNRLRTVDIRSGTMRLIQ
ncbi:TIGR02281 family clan AA aspartic protease [Stappia stellulata]|uniref:retropepsin-like aspartic protease family protein n=1 Tax=Stappia stellulata TaxID=71235 RepID=UPI001CD36F37|nr:TIGR02281 family clan AA aspartic protease [Stappia stellulata]MCA1244567.1 TIGR02281 family clan AA aspartic protease [Stappia stellulata]